MYDEKRDIAGFAVTPCMEMGLVWAVHALYFLREVYAWQSGHQKFQSYDRLKFIKYE